MNSWVALAAGRGPRIFSYYSRTSKWPGFGKDPEWLGCDLSQTSTFFCRQIHYCTLFQLIPKTTLWDRWTLELSLHFTDESQGRYLTCLDHISKWRARLNSRLQGQSPRLYPRACAPSPEQCSSDCGTHGSADSLVSPKGDALYLSNTHPIPFSASLASLAWFPHKHSKVYWYTGRCSRTGDQWLVKQDHSFIHQGSRTLQRGVAITKVLGIPVAESRPCNRWGVDPASCWISSFRQLRWDGCDISSVTGCKTLQLLVCRLAPPHNVRPHSCSSSTARTVLPVFHCKEKHAGAGLQAWFSSTCEEVFWQLLGQKPDFSRQHCAVSHGGPVCMTWAQKPDRLGWNPACLPLCASFSLLHNGVITVLS